MNSALETATVQTTQTPPPQAPKSAWKKIWSDPVARVSLILLTVLYMAAALACPLAPYSMNFSDPDLANAPPSIIYFEDENGKATAPFILEVKRTFDPQTMRQDYTQVPGKHHPIRVFVSGEPYKLFGLIDCKIHLLGVDAPGRLFIIGSDTNGRDNFSRLFFGAQKSLTIGFLGLFIAFPIGLIYGGLSGFLGGRADNVMMRIAEAVMSIPTFYLLIALAAIIPPGMGSSERFALITAILSFIGWAGLARVIRGMVLTIREEEFVQAARAAGMREFVNVIIHVLPQTASFVIVAATLQVPSFILSESGLSFIGLGIQQPDASWGNMLKAALDNANDLLAQPWLLAPGVLIFVTILGFNTLGDVVRDVLDPRMQGRA